MELQDNQPLKVVLAIFFRKNLNGSHQFFLQQRIKSSHQLIWEFPGGKIELSERADQSLIREIQEELDLDLTLIDSKYINPFEMFKYSYSELTVQLNSFLIHYDFIKESYGDWFYLNQMEDPEFSLIEGSRQIVNSLKKYFCE